MMNSGGAVQYSAVQYSTVAPCTYLLPTSVTISAETIQIVYRVSSTLVAVAGMFERSIAQDYPAVSNNKYTADLLLLQPCRGHCKSGRRSCYVVKVWEPI